MNEAGRLIMTIGGALLLAGFVIMVIGRFFPSAGNLPGDLKYESENVKVYFPFATMIILSIVLTIILNVIGRFFK